MAGALVHIHLAIYMMKFIDIPFQLSHYFWLCSQRERAAMKGEMTHYGAVDIRILIRTTDLW